MMRAKKLAGLSAAAFGFGMLMPLLNASAAIIDGSTGMLNGHGVNAFAELNASNQLTAVGFQISAAAIRDPGAGPGEVFLTLPAQANATNILELAIEWNPEGHPPPGIYDKPHFDFHFYYIPTEQRMMIPGGVVDPIDPKFLPPGYTQPTESVPMMGSHTFDVTGAEFNGGEFTQTFIYGYYGGQEIFLEPMATQDYLINLPPGSPDRFDIRQPSQYALPLLPSLVPTSMHYAYDAGQDLYTVNLGDFVTAAVPEPATTLLLALGIPAASLLTRRRKASPAHLAV